MASNDRFFHSAQFFVSISTRIQKGGFQRFVELEISSREFLFQIPYEMFVLKKLLTLDRRYFKATGAMDPEPKRMEYFIFCAPWLKPFALLLLFGQLVKVSNPFLRFKNCTNGTKLRNASHMGLQNFRHRRQRINIFILAKKWQEWKNAKIQFMTYPNSVRFSSMAILEFTKIFSWFN